LRLELDLAEADAEITRGMVIELGELTALTGATAPLVQDPAEHGDGVDEPLAAMRGHSGEGEEVLGHDVIKDLPPGTLYPRPADNCYLGHKEKAGGRQGG
jgi:hypothetical protein